MRENMGLYRGKHKGKWIYGCLFPINSNIVAIIDDEINCGQTSNGDIWIDDILLLVDPETVSMYINLTDKNHKKIFEGDIIKTYDGVYAIKWDNTRAMFYLKNPVTKMSADFYNYFGSDLTIIGNIYDNPELLNNND